MNLTEIAKKILNEDSWGNNPSAAAGQNPGEQTAATPPPATGNVKFHDIKKDYTTFTSAIEKQEEAAKKKFDADLTKALGNKKITVRASKGSVGQVEKDYSLTVASADIVYLKDKFYVVLVGTDKSEYYINTDFKIKVDATAPAAPEMASGKTGNIVHQPVIGTSAKG
jgi:hypothetical protein